MFHSMLLAAIQSTTPDTALWHWQGTPIIIGSCLLVLFIASRTIRFPQVGAKMPLPFPSLFNNISVGGFLAAMSFGHMIGVTAVIVLSNMQVLK